jgi:cytochrome c oxidase subunit II
MHAELLARTRSLLTGTGLLLCSSVARADWSALNMPPGVTPISREVYDLHMLILWICVAIGVVVFGVMFYSIYHHRKSRGAVAASFHESTTVELAWTIVPFLILVGMAIPATKTLIAMEDTSGTELTVKITGYQWMWKYDYLNEELSFYSALSTPREQLYGLADKNENYLLEVDNPLVLPVETRIRLLTTAADVIHAWWVPDLGWKRDAIPGFINDNWTYIEEPGIYRGQCAELCGKDHGFMPVVVHAVTKEEFQQWLAEQKGEQVAAAAEAEREWSRDELMAKGREIHEQTCAACHQANGRGVPGVFPAINGSQIATGPVDDYLGLVMQGKPGTAMQGFAGQLDDVELAAVITYQRNAWDNRTGDMVQPATIQALR